MPNETEVRINPQTADLDQIRSQVWLNDNYTERGLVNGTFQESFNALASSTAGVVTLTLTNAVSGDLTMQFSDGNSTLDCTTAPCTIALTATTDDAPQANYIYIPITTKTLTKSTTTFPTNAEHIKVGYFLVPSAAYAEADGLYINQNWNDHLEGTDNMGHIAHMAERSRRDGAYYFSGIDPNGTDQGAVSSYYDYVSGTEAYFKSSSGVVYQMHRHAVTAKDTRVGSDDVHVVNWFGDAYHDLHNLADIVDDSLGNSLANSYYNLFFFAVGNKTGEYSPVMCQVPSGSYNSQGSAENDVDLYDNLVMPRQFSLDSSTGVPICRITLRSSGGSITHISTKDLRRSAGGGGAGTAGSTHFADNQFTVFNVTDNTKIGAFDMSIITSGNTRTLTFPDLSDTIAVVGTDNSFTANQTISKVDPEHRLTDTGNSEYTRVTKSDTNEVAQRFNRVDLPGAVGNAGSFLTASNQFFSVGDIDIVGDFTVACWIKVNSISVNNPIYGRTGGTANTAQYWFDANTNDLRMVVGNGAANVIAQAQNVLTTGWHFVVGRYNASTGFTDCWVDNTQGNLTRTLTGTQNHVTTNTDYIGSLTGSGAEFDGLIDEMAVYDSVLNTAEMTTLYNAGSGRYGLSADTNLVAGWHFDESSGNADNYEGTASWDGVNNGTVTYASGKVMKPSSTTETSIWKSENSGDASIDGIQTFGDVDGTTLLTGTKLGFFAQTGSVVSTGWAVSNVTSDKTYDANATTLDIQADVLGTLINELKSKGLISA